MISISTIKINLVLFFISLAYYCISTFVKKRMSKKGARNMSLNFIPNENERIEGTNYYVRTLTDEMVQVPSYFVGKVILSRKLVVEVYFHDPDYIDEEDLLFDEDVTFSDVTFLHLLIRQHLLQSFDRAQVKCTKVESNKTVLPVIGMDSYSLMSCINIFENSDAGRRINEDIVLITRFPELIEPEATEIENEDPEVDDNDGQSN